ncbi:MAG: hypothetical protein L6Q37_17230 [Bdellovibrionaceae bacterium]|nr:hypothetical protein [Pseudobdellovibrionaceae bacterium]NUM59610.1 hypothetical protein [Pseudobdellovibrionaceae bacterium]
MGKNPKNGDPSNPISKPLQPLGITRITLSEKPDYSKEIVEKYLSGCSASEIGGLFSCSKQKVLAILKKQKINIRPPIVVTTRTAVLKQRSKSGAKPFYGFCYFEGALTKHPIEFPVLLKIHRMWAGGRTIHQINQELDKHKVKSREGKKWSWAAVRNIVQRFEQKILIVKNGGLYELR